LAADLESAVMLQRLLAREFGSESPVRDVGPMVRYLHLLEKWNLRVNLTGSVEWRILRPLFEEAIWASRLYPASLRKHLDIGSGAGFPAIPLRILNPWIHLEMVESRLKRAVFLESAVHELGLRNTSVHNLRAEQYLRRAGPGGWDCVSWKGIKLNEDLVQLLCERSAHYTQFWMFHGREPAVTSVPMLEEKLTLVGRHAFPAGRNWYLSIYRKR